MTPGQRRAYAALVVLVLADLLYSLACLFRIAQHDRDRAIRARHESDRIDALRDELMTRGPGERNDHSI